MSEVWDVWFVLNTNQVDFWKIFKKGRLIMTECMA